MGYYQPKCAALG